MSLFGFNYKDLPPYCVAYCFYRVTGTLHDDPTVTQSRKTT